MTPQGGTYTLLVALDGRRRIEVGALGEITFDHRWYAYTGSALGPGGFSRVDRHREMAAGERDVRHWHVDYLLGHPGTTIDAVWTTPGADRECAIAADLPGDQVAAFGASDCECATHLVGADERATLADAIADVHDLGPANREA
ncbi:hypothetical protein L593_12790 [Salinarchaeum sp. Harcht-Bsk1]|uniref:GIY-YIG nuclease family protein n=1 Tax=Salinarchaeum sp. Harcht-Bsk1 TaxID=1333523 RepID=UPI0003423663|nr:DUF123 domain-containing protein [Salinarchaeum sp. Harcht-Bsk1]AGN02497.1 hypothetical protein L593_12790 [Salinarchaeum sp. Harcht-Bsk1]